MIYDRISHASKYKLPVEALKVLNDLTTTNFEVGRYEYDNGVYLLIQSYTTKMENDCKLEAHKKYVDIQCVLTGVETMGYTYDGEIIVPYNEDKDVYYLKSNLRYITLTSNEFITFDTDEYHMPKIGDGGSVKKAVVKVPVELFK